MAVYVLIFIAFTILATLILGIKQYREANFDNE